MTSNNYKRFNTFAREFVTKVIVSNSPRADLHRIFPTQKFLIPLEEFRNYAVPILSVQKDSKIIKSFDHFSKELADDFLKRGVLRGSNKDVIREFSKYALLFTIFAGEKSKNPRLWAKTFFNSDEKLTLTSFMFVKGDKGLNQTFVIGNCKFSPLDIGNFTSKATMRTETKIHFVSDIFEKIIPLRNYTHVYSFKTMRRSFFNTKSYYKFSKSLAKASNPRVLHWLFDGLIGCFGMEWDNVGLSSLTRFSDILYVEKSGAAVPLKPTLWAQQFLIDDRFNWFVPRVFNLNIEFDSPDFNDIEDCDLYQEFTRGFAEWKMQDPLFVFLSNYIGWRRVVIDYYMSDTAGQMPISGLFAMGFAALETLFTDDRRNASIQEQLKIRIPRFVSKLDIEVSNVSGVIESIYTTRSNAVHGEYLGSSIDKVAQQIREMDNIMQLVFKGLEESIKTGKLDQRKKHLEFLKSFE